MTTTAAAPKVLRGLDPLDVPVPKDDDPDDRYYSVTTIIGVLDKPALVPWAAKETAQAAIRSKATWESILEENGEHEAERYLTGARFRPPKGSKRSAAELGTAFHTAAQEYALDGVIPDLDDEVRPYFEQFDGWLQRFSPSYQAVETTVYSPRFGYAGTCDGFLTIDGVRLIVDYKTSRKAIDAKGNPTTPYPEVALQLAAYRYAEIAALWRPRRFESFRRRYYLLSQQERSQAIPVLEVDGGVCIHVTTEHCEAFPVRCDERVHEAFLFAQECARWTFQDSRGAIGEPLTPGGAS